MELRKVHVLTERKKWEDGQNFTVKKFIMCIFSININKRIKSMRT